MALRTATVFLGLTLLLLSACGGGSSTTDVIPADPLAGLNGPEKELVGTYQLVDFTVREVNCVPCGPEDFDAWGGSMELRADRTATVAVELCEHGTDPTASCDREFVWTADAGLLNLHSTEPGEPDVIQEWVLEGMGSVTTDSVLPTNIPDVGLLLVADGRETLRWVRTDSQ